MKLLGGALALGLVGAIAALAPGSAQAVDYDCANFSNQAQAQEYLLPGDPYGLDADNDGIACESLPCPCNTSASPAPSPSPTPSPPAPAPIQPPPAETVEQPEPVFWKPFQEPVEVEPSEILIGTGTLGGTFQVGSLTTWEGWGTEHASAEGVVRLRKCLPDCIRGHIIERRATVMLTKVRSSCGQRRYSEIEILVVNGPEPIIGPYGIECDGSLDLTVAPSASSNSAQAYMSCGYPPTHSAFLESTLEGKIHYAMHPPRCSWSDDGSGNHLAILVGLRWSNWGGKVAAAHGKLVDGHDQDRNGFQRHSVRVWLSDLRPPVGSPSSQRLYYTRMKIFRPGFGTFIEQLFRPGQAPVQTG